MAERRLFSDLSRRILHGQGVGAMFARGASGAFLGKILGMGLGFLLQIFMARVLGVDQYGSYMYALAWVSIAMMLALLGYDTALLRFIARYQAEQDWGKLRGVLRHAMWWVLLGGLLVAALASLLTWLLSARMEAGLAPVMFAAVPLIPILALSSLRQSALRGYKQVFRAELPESIFRPLLIMAMIWVWWSWQGKVSATEAMFVQTAAALAAFILGGWWLHRATPAGVYTVAPKYDPEWARVALPMLMIAGLHIILKQTDVVMIGILTGSRDSGIYGAMVRLADLAVFGLTAANAITGTLISELYSTGRKAELQRLLTLSSRVVLAFTLAVSAVLVVGGNWIAGLFGPEFTSGVSALWILLAAQMVNAATGPVGYLMTMTGHQNQALVIQGLAAVINVVLNLLLIPSFGMAGAAIATATAIIFWNIAMFVYVKRQLGLRSMAF